MSDYQTTTRFAAQGFSAIVRDGLERVHRAIADAGEAEVDLAARQADLSFAKHEDVVRRCARVHVATADASRSNT